MTRIGPLRFFGIVSLHSPLMILALALVGCAAGGAVLVHPGSGSRALVPVLVVQMFAASTGFAVHARRGHLDLLLTGGPSRRRIAGAHLVMSTTPGLAVWFFVALVEIACRPPRLAVCTTGSAVAMAVVSGVSWAITVPFPRLSGAIAWMLVGVTVLAVVPRAQAVAFGAADSTLAEVLVVLACPLALAGHPIGAADAHVAGAALALAACAIGAALAWMTNTDVALEAAQ
jgi:hypothetical protein